MIIPDTEDRTWVFEHPRSDCGLDTAAVIRMDVAGLVRVNAASWTTGLSEPAAGDQQMPSQKIVRASSSASSKASR